MPQRELHAGDGILVGILDVPGLVEDGAYLGSFRIGWDDVLVDCVLQRESQVFHIGSDGCIPVHAISVESTAHVETNSVVCGACRIAFLCIRIQGKGLQAEGGEDQ